MWSFVRSGPCTYIFAISTFIFFSSADARPGELSAPDPLKAAYSRLQDLSTFVDKHFQSVDAVNKAASNRAAANKNLSVDISGLIQLGGNRTIANMMRLNELESASTGLKLDFLEEHQRQLADFSKNLHQAQKDIVGLPPSAATRKYGLN